MRYLGLFQPPNRSSIIKPFDYEIFETVSATEQIITQKDL